MRCYPTRSVPTGAVWQTNRIAWSRCTTDVPEVLPAQPAIVLRAVPSPDADLKRTACCCRSDVRLDGGLETPSVPDGRRIAAWETPESTPASREGLAMAYASATSSGAAFKDRYLPILSLVLGALGVLLGLVVITAHRYRARYLGNPDSCSCLARWQATGSSCRDRARSNRSVIWNRWSRHRRASRADPWRPDRRD
jgi:hypothetical protein